MTAQRQDATVEFSVAYEGDALAEGRMPVRDLAPALFALGQAFDRANAVLNGESASVSLEVRANQRGSFEVVLILDQLIETAINFLSDDFVASAVNLKELVIGGPGLVGLITLIKRSKGERPKVIESNQDTITVEIDKLRISVPAKAWALYNDSNLKQQVEAVVRPVVKDGIDRVVFKQRSEPLETVDKSEAQYFRREAGGDEMTTEIMIPRQRLQPSSVNFRRRGKWKLSDGQSSHWYTIKDEDFIRDVDSGARLFGSKDLLVCEVVITQSAGAKRRLEGRLRHHRCFRANPSTWPTTITGTSEWLALRHLALTALRFADGFLRDRNDALC